ncbi:hypothetical protein Tco_1413816, partial [Tanacetum coccineum]
MADENVPALAPTRTDDQILSFAVWVPIGKSNFVLDLQKKQKNPIIQIYVDILQNTNFYRAVTASSSVPAIYIQQFWNTLAEALEITPIDQAHRFMSPLSGDAIMDVVNELRYTEVIHFVSRMAVNNLYQPWRAILSIINQCLTSKTSGYDRPRYLVLQMLWGIITSTNVDYAKLMWEEFVQAIQTFLTDKANLGNPTKKGRKDKPHVIPYYEVFGMPIPNELISKNIRNAPYYNAYMEMVAKHDRKIVAEIGEKKKPTTAKQPKPKPAKEKSSKPDSTPKPKKLRKGNPSLQLIYEDESTQPEPEPETEHQGEGDEYDVVRAIQMSLESFQAQSQAHVGGVAIREPVAEATRPLPVVDVTPPKWVTSEYGLLGM